MEDILASIRRILSEDEPEGGARPPEAHGPGPASTQGAAHREVLPLDPAMLVEEPPTVPGTSPATASSASAPSAQPQTPSPAPAAPLPAPSAAMPLPAPDSAPESSPSPASLLAPEAAEAAASSVGSLLRKLAAERQPVAVRAGGPTLEDLVREEMRPLLKQWLDANLPPLVERLVRAEIERVVGRALS